MKHAFLKRVLDIDDNQFLSNLRVTQAYCEQQLRSEEILEWVILRSIINPIHKDGVWLIRMPNCEIDNYCERAVLLEEWAKKADPSDLISFNKVFDNQLRYKNRLTDELKFENNYQGRILIVEYGYNIPDGITECETEGFFDELDFPPIDTWFFKAHDKIHGGILFAWIPERFVELANKAVTIHMLNIIHWFKDWAPLDYRAIMKTE